MNTRIRNSLAEATELSKPAVASRVTPSQYLDILRQASDRGAASSQSRERVALNVLGRWFKQSRLDTGGVAFCEQRLERLASDMASGAFRRTNGQPYGALIRSVPATLQRLHNRAAETDPRVLRKLINRCVSRRLRRFQEFSPQTQKVLLHVEQYGRRSPGKKGRQTKPMTPATRKKAIDSAMTLMSRLQASGVETITREAVDALLNEATRSGKYRTVARMLHCAAPVFRIGHEIGELQENNLDNIDNDTFKDEAQRDFIPPDEVEKMMDLSTLDMGNAQQVRDRLVVLLLYDLAVRRRELAGLVVQDVERENGRFDILLRPDVQKGSKPEKRLRVLFPATESLLGHYLENVRGRFPGLSLIVDMKGQGTSAAAISAAVQREAGADRLDLRCYRSDRRPSPHAFRRTFATINSHPLGLRMSVHELADRLRDSVRVVDESYRLHNPLIDSMRAEQYHQRLSPVVPESDVDAALALIERAGAPTRCVDALKRWRARQAAQSKPATDSRDGDTSDNPDAEVKWIAEDDAHALIAKSWETLPGLRALRDYFRERQALQRAGSKGRLSYRCSDVEQLIGDYVPVSDHLSQTEWRHRSVREMLSVYTLSAIGAVKLIRVSDVSGFLKALRAFRTRSDLVPKLAKQDCQNLQNRTVFETKAPFGTAKIA